MKMPDKNTFRLCILREQRVKLLKPDTWPSNIAITPWIFRKRQNHSEEEAATVGLVANPADQFTHGRDEVSAAQLNAYDSTSATALASVVDITGSIGNHSDDVVTAQLHSSAVTDNDMETNIPYPIFHRVSLLLHLYLNFIAFHVQPRFIQVWMCSSPRAGDCCEYG